jgi:hypothetical protein
VILELIQRCLGFLIIINIICSTKRVIHKCEPTLFFTFYWSISTLSKICCSIPVTSKYPLSITADSTTLSYQLIIANQIAKNKTHNIFLNTPFGFEAHLRFFINFCPNKAINNNITASHNTYANKFNNQIAKLVGSITANIRP